MNVVAVTGDARADQSSLPSRAHGAAIFKIPDQPDTRSPARMAMHINGACEVIAYASRLHAGRSLGGPHSEGVDPSLRLFQRLALHHKHHEMEFWDDEDIEKAIGGEAGLVSAWRSIFPLVQRGRLPLMTCSDPLVVEVGEQRKSSFRSS